jgi:hypothetical protein
MTTTARRRDTAGLGRKVLNKVPEVTIFFTRKDATEARRGAPLPESA